MSRKGECYDNAVVESSFHTLQVERVYLQDYPNHPEVTADRFEYIEVFYKVFYSRQRRHSRLGQVSPAASNDYLPAAHTLAQGLTLATDNVAEFSSISGPAVENWLRP